MSTVRHLHRAMSCVGGGSSTVLHEPDPNVFNNNAINRCSDGCGRGEASDCPWKATKCQRAITTITCITSF